MFHSIKSIFIKLEQLQPNRVTISMFFYWMTTILNGKMFKGNTQICATVSWMESKISQTREVSLIETNCYCSQHGICYILLFCHQFSWKGRREGEKEREVHRSDCCEKADMCLQVAECRITFERWANTLSHSHTHKHTFSLSHTHTHTHTDLVM